LIGPGKLGVDCVMNDAHDTLLWIGKCVGNRGRHFRPGAEVALVEQTRRALRA
jgi:hypothetical protein